MKTSMETRTCFRPRPKAVFREDVLDLDKPTSTAHLRVGGWCEVYVDVPGRPIDTLDEKRIVFGWVEKITPDGKIHMRVADEVFSSRKTDIHDGDLLELDVAQIARSQFSPHHLMFETECERLRRRTALILRYRQEFLTAYPQYEDENRRLGPLERTPEGHKLWHEHLRQYSEDQDRFLGSIGHCEFLQVQ